MNALKGNDKEVQDPMMESTISLSKANSLFLAEKESYQYDQQGLHFVCCPQYFRSQSRLIPEWQS